MKAPEHADTGIAHGQFHCTGNGKSGSVILKFPAAVMLLLFGMNVVSAGPATGPGPETGPPAETAAADIPGNRADRSLQLGDKAFQDGFYGQALEFYAEYRKTVALQDDLFKNATFRMIHCYLRLDKPDLARTLLKEMQARFSNLDGDEENLVQGNILLVEGQFSEARTLFRGLLGRENVSQEIKKKALDGAGFASARLHDWNDAIDMYTRLAELSRGKNFDFAALEQKVLAQLSQQKIEDAKATLDAVPDTEKTAHANEIMLLKILILTRQGDMKSALQLYEKVDKFNQADSRQLLFQTACAMANVFLENKDAVSAIPPLIDAVYAAPEADGRKRALTLLMTAYMQQEDVTNAYGVARRYLQYYRDATPQACEVALNAARLLIRMHREGEALTEFQQIRENSELPLKYRLDAASEAAEVFQNERRYPQALENLRFIAANSPGPDKKAEAMFRIGSLFLMEKKHAEAIDAFLKVDPKQTGWREKAVWKAVLSSLHLKDFRQVLQLTETFSNDFPGSPQSVEATFLHAVALRENGRALDACREFVAFSSANPDSRLAPESLLNGGNILFDSGDYAAAEPLYQDLLNRFPGSDVVPQALYKRMFCRYFLDKGKEMNESIVEDARILETQFPDSSFTIDALFWLAHYCLLHDNQVKADEILERLGRVHSSLPSVASRAIYERAEIARRMGKGDKALAFLVELLEKFPDETVVSKALFLEGDIFYDRRDFEKAITCYQKAVERRPGSSFETACLGRIGDSYFSLYPRDFDPEFLKKSLDFYQQVGKRKNLSPLFRGQTLYKTARCHEELGQVSKAESTYRQIVYENDLRSSTKEEAETLWVVKSAIALVNLYLNKNTPEAAEKALGVYQRLIEAGIGPTEEFHNHMAAIRAEYRL